MTTREIVEKYLKDNGFDGLAEEDCGCSIGDLMPCDNPSPDCRAGHKTLCKDCPKLDCEYRGEKTDCILAE